MQYSLYIPLISSIYIILLIIFYFSKKRLKSNENKIYGLMLVSNLIGLILEIACYYAVRNMLGYEMIEMIILKTYLVYLLSWQMLFTIYIYAITRKNNNAVMSIKSNKIIAVLIGCYVIAIICLYLFDLNKFYNNSIGYTFGLGTNFLYVLFGVLIFTWIIMLIKNRKIVTKFKLIPVFTFLGVGFIVTFIQFSYPWMILITSTESLITMLMFFTIENPDLKLLSSMELAKNEAEKANRAKSDFLSSMSHEIRTPLNAIVGFSELTETSRDLNEAKENAREVVKASLTLLELVNSILDISRIESGSMEITNSEYNPTELFMDTSKLLKNRMEEKGLEFRINIAPDIPKILYGDKSNIKKILTNLLTNACKYTDEGFVEFKVVCVNKDDICNLIISVEDTGRGIKKENIDKLFTKFNRLDEDRNTTIEGTGLGLAITKQLIELMDGKIVVQSIFGSGSKFTVSLVQRIKQEDRFENAPIVVVTSNSNEDKLEKTLNSKTENVNDGSVLELRNEVSIESNNISLNKTTDILDLSNKKILLIDDNKLNLKIATKLLSVYNTQIYEVYSGQECIDKINSGEQYDLILADDMMPNMTGTEMMKNLRESGYDLPIVVLTANAMTGEEEKYLSVGFDDYLAKPIVKTELIRVLNKFLVK